jgi:hypothetical protein
MAQSSRPPSTGEAAATVTVGWTSSQASEAGAGGEEEASEEEESERVNVLGLRRRCGFGEGRSSGWSAE